MNLHYMENRKENNEGVAMSFLAIKPFMERTIIAPTEQVVTGKDWVRWGDRNAYPEYLDGLSAECTTLRTIQQGLVDYVCGNGVVVSGLDAEDIDGHGMTAAELVERSAKDAARLGGFAWELIPNKGGELARIVPMKFKYVRLNKEADVVYYSENWSKASADVLVYGRWRGEFARDEKTGEWRSAVLVVKCWGDNVYPEPLYAAAVKACETERGIDEFHLGNLERGFMGSYLVNFCNGVPTDEIKKQIERDFTQKFGGAKNAGRVMFNYAADKEHLAVLQKMDVADYADKYETLAKHCRQQIFTAFRANPNLFGIPTEDNGFNSEEYESTFKLFNRTIVHPLQEKICAAWHKATGGDMSIEPFTLEGAEKDAGDNNANGTEE